MWPLKVSELAKAIAPDAVPASGNLDPTIASHSLFRAIAWIGPELGEHDAFFVLERTHHSEVVAALEGGAVCVVAHDWDGLADVDAHTRQRCFLAKSPRDAFRRFAAFFRTRFTFPVIAVGGSNGKTTTKDMIAHILATNGRRATSTPGTNNGWNGIPTTLCHPGHTDPAPEALVLEIGIDEKGAMRDHVAIAQPDIAVITALGPEHLAGLGTLKDVVREELDLFAGSKGRVWLADEPALAERLHLAHSGDLIVREASTVRSADLRTLTYSWRPTSPTAGALTLAWHGATRDAHVPMPGAHNGRNAALAIATALLHGRPLDEVADALSTFTGPDRRCSVRNLPSGCVLIDDSYNASPSSIEAAFDVLSGFDPRLERVVILGDMLDLGAEAAPLHEGIGRRLALLRGAHVRLYGEYMPALAPLLTGAASVGRADLAEDPSVLVDLSALDRHVVLVKGSRGMALKRVVDKLEALSAVAWDADAIGVGITGAGAEDLARVVRAVAAARPEVIHTPVFVRALDRADLTGGETCRHSYHVAVITGSPPRTDATDVEGALAAIAQLLVHLPRGGTAVLPSTTEDEDAEAMELLASVIPAHAKTRRASRCGDAGGLCAVAAAAVLERIIAHREFSD